MKSFATLPADARRALARRELRRRQIDDDRGMVCGIRPEQFTDEELEEVGRIGTEDGQVTQAHLEALASGSYVMSATEEAALDAVIRRAAARIRSEGRA